MPDDPATDDYIDNMDQRPGMFEPQRFRQAPLAQYTDDAKDLIKQLRNQYNAGQPDVVQAVKDYEMQRYFKVYRDFYQFDDPKARDLAANDVSQYGSGDKMGQESAWNLFYQAHQRYIGSALAREDPMSDADQKTLEDQHGFDMGGAHLFNFEPLIQKGVIKPRNVPDYDDMPRPGPPPTTGIDFDKLFKSGR